MSNSEYRPRLTIDIPEELLNELRSLIPWGIRSKIFEVIIQDFVTMLKENNPGYVVGALLARDIDLKDIVNLDLPKE